MKRNKKYSPTSQVIEIKELDLELIKPQTKTFMDPEIGGAKIVVIGAPGCFERGTEVLMWDGTIKTVESVSVGDKVMGWDSTPRTVLQLCRGVDMMYKILPVKGVPYTVNGQHKLVLQNKYIRTGSVVQFKTIEITVEKYLKKDK